jgi:hypothetical protein
MALATALLLLAGCQTPAQPRLAPGATGAPGGAASAPPSAELLPSPSPTATPTPAPTPTPSPARLKTGFEDVPAGQVPPDFVDVASEKTVPAWVYPGNWKVATDERNNKVFLHDDVREQPAVSFMRYKGAALGKPNGQLPEVYYAEVAMRPLRSPNNYPPTGDQGVQFYYLDYNRYVEVVVKPDQIEIWECNGGEPKTTKGWKRLWGQSLTTKAGDVRRVGALVDAPNGAFSAYLDGQPLQTIHSDLIKPQAAWLALRGIGNTVSFDDLLVEPRASGTP